ncbi:MAG: hypothetical protein J6R88_01340 [Clostridia bacterium]|nr:hypothetical protein [Clostridia bacterium]
MKKFTKSLLGAVLSVAMVVTGGLAVIGYKPVPTKAAETQVETTVLAENVVTSEGATATIGAKASASGNTKAHAGLVLTGGAGATFDLGTIDLSKSNWTMAEGDDSKGYKTLPESASPFVTWYYTIGNANSAPEILELKFYLYDHNDPTNYVEIGWVDYRDSAPANNGSTKVYVKGSKQSTKAIYRANKGMQASPAGTAVRKGKMYDTGTPLIGYSGNATIRTYGSSVPFNMFFDLGKDSVYSLMGHDDAGDFKLSYLLRDFTSNNAGETGAISDDVYEAGKVFSSSYVDVRIEFASIDAEVCNETSIVLESFGGKLLTGDTVTVIDSDYVVSAGNDVPSKIKTGELDLTVPSRGSAFTGNVDYMNSILKIKFDDEVKETITFDTKVKSYNFEEYGTYVLEYYDETGETLLGTKNVLVTNGNVKSVVSTGGSAVYDSVASKNENALYTHEGLVLTGSKGATFNLGTIDISKSFWNGTYFAIPESAAPFISFNYIVGSNIEVELKTLKIRLYDSADHSKYFDVWWVDTADENGALFAYAQASGQLQQGAYRKYDGTRGGKLLTNVTKSETSKEINALFGYGEKASSIRTYGSNAPITLIYDTNQKAVYSHVTYGSGELANSYVIRDFDEPVYEEGHDPSGDTVWGGFSSNLVDVEIVFENVIDSVETTSIVVRELGGTTFAGGETVLAFDERAELNRGGTLNLNKFAGNKYENGVVLEYETGAIKKYSVDGGEKFTNKMYTFNELGEKTVEFFDAEDNKLGETIVNVISDLRANVTVTNGNVYYKRGEAEKAVLENNTKLELGDVITVEGGVHEITGDTYEDIKSFIVNGTELALVTNNVALAIDGYSYVISEADLSYAQFTLVVELDNYCDITIVDEYDGETVKYVWQNDKGENDAGIDVFPHATVKNGAIKNPANNNYEFIGYGASGGEKILVAYGRDDKGYLESYVAEYNEELGDWDYDNPALDENGVKKVQKVNAVYTTSTGATGLPSNKFNADDAGGNRWLDKYECIVKGMKFTAIYVDVDVKTVVSINGEGATFTKVVADFDKEDLDIYASYVGSEQVNISLRYSHIDEKPAENNPVIAAAEYGNNNVNLKLSDGDVEKLENVYRLTIDMNNVAIEKNFFAVGAVIKIDSGKANATCNISPTLFLNEEVVMREKIDAVLSETAGNGHLYAIEVNGAKKYSKLLLEDLQKLYTAANDTETTLAKYVAQE